jgi:obg-like ATPase 1
VIDIAGLVKGASEGAGLGNAFLSNIRAVDGIFHVCRAFDDADIVHVEGEVNPVRDLAIIHEELRLKDLEFLEKNVDKLGKEVARIGNGGTATDKLKKEEFVCETRKLVVGSSILTFICIGRFAKGLQVGI